MKPYQNKLSKDARDPYNLTAKSWIAASNLILGYYQLRLAVNSSQTINPLKPTDISPVAGCRICKLAVTKEACASRHNTRQLHELLQMNPNWVSVVS